MINKKIYLWILCLQVLVVLPFATQAQQGIDISAGSNITFFGAATIEINSGDFINNGSYSKDVETITFTGITAQKISGSSNTILNNLVFNNTAGISAQMDLLTCNNLTVGLGGNFSIDAAKSVTVSGTLTNNATAAGLLLKSDANGTASLLHNTASVIATAERYIANDNSWHLISAPVDGQLITPAFAATLPNTSFDFYKWNEAIDITTGLTWVNLRNAGGNLNTTAFGATPMFEVGKGYLVAYSNTYANGSNHSFTGSLNNGDKSVAVAYSNNHNELIGNPYASAIDWDASGYTGRDTYLGAANPGIWIWNQTAGNYGVYANPSGTNNVTNIIAPHQGFFVQTTSTGTFSIPQSARVHPGTQQFLKSTPVDCIRLKVNSTANTYSDEVIVQFDANANQDGMSKWFSMITDAPSLYSVKNNQLYTINTLPACNNNLTVEVGFKAGVNGNYAIYASGLNSFTASKYIYLKDLKTNYLQDLNQKVKYSFAATTADNTNRFQLIFALSPLSISDNEMMNTSIFAYDNTITINSNEAIQQIAIYNTMGQIIKTIGKTNGTQTVNMTGNATGYYIVRVVTEKNVYSEKVFIK